VSVKVKEQRNTLLAKAQAILNVKPYSKQAEAEFTSIMKLVDAIDQDRGADVRAIEANSKLAEIRGEEVSAKELRAEAEFKSFVRGEKRTYSALAEGLAPGSYVVGYQWRATYLAKLAASSGWLAAGATVANTENGRKYLSFLSDDTANMASIVGENSLVPSNNATYSQPSPDNVAFGTFTTVSRQLVQDSAFDIGNHLANLFAVRVARKFNLYASSEVGGSGLFAQLGASAPSSSSSSVPTTDELLAMQDSSVIDPAYLSADSAPCFLISPAMRVRLMKQKEATTGAILYPELKDNRLLGYPVALNVNQSSASGGVAVVFGSVKRAILVHDITPHLAVSLERYAEFLQVYFSLQHRMGVTITDAAAVNCLKLA
jgi:HK97 family phage major capsid protein